MPFLWTDYEAGAAATLIAATWKRLVDWLLCGPRQHDCDLLALLGAVPRYARSEDRSEGSATK